MIVRGTRAATTTSSIPVPDPGARVAVRSPANTCDGSAANTDHTTVGSTDRAPTNSESATPATSNVDEATVPITTRWRRCTVGTAGTADPPADPPAGRAGGSAVLVAGVVTRVRPAVLPR